MTLIYLDQNWLFIQDITVLGALLIFFAIFLIQYRMYRQLLGEMEHIYTKMGWEWKKK